MSTQKILVIIQARLNSTRLPNKILLPVSDDNKLTLIEYMLSRLQKALDIPILVAIPKTSKNNDLANFLERRNIKFYRGHETDVLSRYLDCAKRYKAEYVVRLTSDCPLVDPYLINRMIAVFFYKSLDYLSNTTPPEQSSFPDGSDIEIFSFDALQRASIEIEDSKYREHVTFQFWDDTYQYKTEVFKQKKSFSHLRYTIDHYEDYLVFKNIYKDLLSISESFCGFMEIQDFLEKNKEIQILNSRFNPGDNW